MSRPVAQLQRLSVLLDTALDLDAAQHEAWLAGLQGDDAALVQEPVNYAT